MLQSNTTITVFEKSQGKLDSCRRCTTRGLFFGVIGDNRVCAVGKDTFMAIPKPKGGSQLVCSEHLCCGE